jgi:hypothetical protein
MKSKTKIEGVTLFLMKEDVHTLSNANLKLIHLLYGNQSDNLSVSDLKVLLFGKSSEIVDAKKYHCRQADYKKEWYKTV